MWLSIAWPACGPATARSCGPTRPCWHPMRRWPGTMRSMSPRRRCLPYAAAMEPGFGPFLLTPIPPRSWLTASSTCWAPAYKPSGPAMAPSCGTHRALAWDGWPAMGTSSAPCPAPTWCRRRESRRHRASYGSGVPATAGRCGDQLPMPGSARRPWPRASSAPPPPGGCSPSARRVLLVWIYTTGHPPSGVWQGGSAIVAGRRLRAAYWEGRGDGRED
jgi:hypothetical protein